METTSGQVLILNIIIGLRQPYFQVSGTHGSCRDLPLILKDNHNKKNVFKNLKFRKSFLTVVGAILRRLLHRRTIIRGRFLGVKLNFICQKTPIGISEYSKSTDNGLEKKSGIEHAAQKKEKIRVSHFLTLQEHVYVSRAFLLCRRVTDHHRR